MPRRLFPAAMLLALAVGAAPADDRQVENPVYTSWARFRPGASVTYRAVSETRGHADESTTTYTLVEIDAKKCAIEMTVISRFEGKETKNGPQRLESLRTFNLPPGVSKEEFGKPKGPVEAGEEVVTVLGKPYKARWTRHKDSVEAGELLSQTWTSDEVPGGLIKTVGKVPATGTTKTMDLVEIKTP